MIIKYKNYVGAIVYMQQLQGRKYRIAILDKLNLKQGGNNR